MTVQQKRPNPGSDAAIRLGCTCPVLDNHHGAGFPYGGKTCFWYTDGCPVHQKPTTEEDKPNG